jgi:hypothetical protein
MAAREKDPMSLSVTPVAVSAWRGTARIVALALAAAVSLLLSPSSALAASVTLGPGYATSVTYLGLEVIGGVRTVCIDSSAASPTGLLPGTTVRDPKTAYLLSRYASTSSDTTAAALAYVVKKKYDSTTGAADRALRQRPEERQIRAAIARLNIDATANAGPYTVSARISAKPGTVPTRGTVTGIAVRGAGGSNAAPPGAMITVTLSGPGVFDATGTRTRTFAAATSAQSAAWHATGEGAISVTARASGLPPTTFVVHRKQAQGYQRVVSASMAPGTTTATARLAGAVTATFSPTAATQIQASTVLGAGRSVPVSDRVRVSGAQPNSTVAVTVTYYWTPDRPVRSATHPASAVRLGSATVAVITGSTGAGTAEAPGPDVSRTYGWVSATESIAATTTSKGFHSDFGVASESTPLPSRPIVSTTVRSQPVSSGRVDLVDQVMVSAASPNDTVRVDVPFYLDRDRPTPSPTPPTTASLAGMVSVLVRTDAAGNGSATATLRGVAVSRSSWAVGMERIPAVAATATTPAVIAYQAPYGQATESTQLCAPVPSTRLQKRVLPGGTRVRLVDVVTVTGACANSVVPVVVPFYLDTSEPRLRPVAPETARLLSTVTVQVQTDGSGSGTATATGPEVDVRSQAAVWGVGMERIDGLPGSSTRLGTLGRLAPYQTPRARPARSSTPGCPTAVAVGPCSRVRSSWPSPEPSVGWWHCAGGTPSSVPRAPPQAVPRKETHADAEQAPLPGCAPWRIQSDPLPGGGCPLHGRRLRAGAGGPAGDGACDR